MPASLCAQSAKNGISVPSATLATKNRNEPTRAARGAARKRGDRGRQEFENARHVKAPCASRPMPAPAGGDRSGALADVNAYGAGEAARPQRLRQDGACCKFSGERPSWLINRSSRAGLPRTSSISPARCARPAFRSGPGAVLDALEALQDGRRRHARGFLLDAARGVRETARAFGAVRSGVSASSSAAAAISIRCWR